MGALTVQDFITRVSRQFGDEAQAQVTTDDITNWINDAVREIVAQNNLLQKQASANTVVGQSQYSLPDDVLRFRRVAYNGISLRPITIEEADELIPDHSETTAQGLPTGTSTHYWIFAGQINLYPTPDQSVTNGLILYYTKLPTPVVATTDIPETPAEYDNRILEFCLGQAFELDMNTTMMQVKNTQFQQGVDRLKGNSEWENQEFYPNVTMVQEYPQDIVGGAY